MQITSKYKVSYLDAFVKKCVKIVCKNDHAFLDHFSSTSTLKEFNTSLI